MRSMALAALMGAGCVSLDTMIHSPVHCSTVSKETCQLRDAWDKQCVPCGQPYYWGQDYDWMPGTLLPGDVIRTVPTGRVVPVPLETLDGDAILDAYFIAAHGSDRVLADITVLYGHGNYGGIEHYQPRLRMLYEWGVNIIVWDYRGYGKSEPPGAPDADQFLTDTLQVWEHLALSHAPNRDKIISYGFSLGSIPAVETGLYGTPCAMILETPFPSISLMTDAASTLTLPGGFLTEGRYELVETIGEYRGPLMVMAGTADSVIRYEDMVELYDAAPGPKRLWSLNGVDHGIATGGVPEAGMREYFAEMQRFLNDEGAACLGQ